MTEQREQYAVVPVTPVAMMPAVNMESMLQRHSQMVEFFKRILVENTDYGTIPGTQKPTLLKPGAEKLKMFFGLTHSFEVLEKIVDWDKPLFYFMMRCHLYYNGIEVGQGDGSCNSREIKYRYRQADRVCPICGKPTIMRGKAEYGGGWLCFAKHGGCGAKFKIGDKSIEGQETGRIENPDVADVVNTILKQAEKRAFVGAVIITTNASEFVTQDLEDGVIEGKYQEHPAGKTEPTKVTKVESTKPGNGNPQPAAAASKMMWKGTQPPAEPPEEQLEKDPNAQPNNPDPMPQPTKAKIEKRKTAFFQDVLREISYYKSVQHVGSDLLLLGYTGYNPANDVEMFFALQQYANKKANAEAAATEVIDINAEMQKTLDAPGE